ncbi:MAG: hypothetical protein K0R80_1859 [Clostridia bacterium]|jgi:hypothetical protein|nr:hypothetical protein [Clostridia bacterium]
MYLYVAAVCTNSTMPYLKHKNSPKYPSYFYIWFIALYLGLGGVSKESPSMTFGTCPTFLYKERPYMCNYNKTLYF